MDFELNYDELIQLDAEDLAEAGVGKAYEMLLPKLRQYVTHPAKIEEDINNDLPRYSVACGTKKFAIYAPDLEGDEGQSWGRATYALFTIINDQSAKSDYRLYAINGGNDLCGIFLTPEQAQAARKSLPNRSDWPYLPTNEYPWYGQQH